MPFNYKNIVGATLVVAQNNRAGARPAPYSCPKDRVGARPAPAVNHAMTLNLNKET